LSGVLRCVLRSVLMSIRTCFEPQVRSSTGVPVPVSRVKL
jgi:hypothetical protein